MFARCFGDIVRIGERPSRATDESRRNNLPEDGRTVHPPRLLQIPRET
jgi:hypothetical protein